MNKESEGGVAARMGVSREQLSGHMVKFVKRNFKNVLPDGASQRCLGARYCRSGFPAEYLVNQLSQVVLASTAVLSPAEPP